MSSGFTQEWLEAHRAKQRSTTEQNRANLAKGPKKPRRSKAGATVAKSATVANVVVGIDPGVKTGIGIYHGKELAYVGTTTIIEALARVAKCHEAGSVMVYVEDARMATYKRGGKDEMAKAQGAGSIKRDCKIWEDELTRLSIPHRMVKPNKQSNAIAANKQMWEGLTGYTKRNSEHARDAVMIARRFI